MNSIPFLAAPNYAYTQAWVEALQAAMPSEKIVAFSDLSEAERASCQVAIVANPDPAQLQVKYFRCYSHESVNSSGLTFEPIDLIVSRSPSSLY